MTCYLFLNIFISKCKFFIIYSLLLDKYLPSVYNVKIITKWSEDMESKFDGGVLGNIGVGIVSCLITFLRWDLEPFGPCATGRDGNKTYYNRGQTP